MKHIKKFNETKKEDKIEDQEVLFNAEVLVDKDEKPSFTTDVEDQEKVKKEFDKLRKVKSFENFTIEVEVEVKPEGEEESEEESEEEYNTPHSFEPEQEEGCSCGCQDCACGSEEESNPETDVKVMNIADFMNSIAGQ
jgi:hypothetical protein